MHVPAPCGRWFEQIQSWTVPTHYYHVVFTLPHELNPLVATNQALLCQVLMQSVAQTLLRRGQQQLGVKLGFTLVLHSWGQEMKPHYHCHMITTGGGLVHHQSQWREIADPDGFFAAGELAADYRWIFLRKLKKRYRMHSDRSERVKPGSRLQLPAELEELADPARFQQWLRPLLEKSWVIHWQPMSEKCQEPDDALKYLSRYVAGMAIGNTRIVRDENGQVTFEAKDYRRGGVKVEITIPGHEFLDRFVQHILPQRFMRVT